MFPQAVRAVREIRPAAFIFENVRGLARPAFRNYVEYIRLQMTHPDFPVSSNIPWDKNLARLQRFHSQKGKNRLVYRVLPTGKRKAAGREAMKGIIKTLQTK